MTVALDDELAVPEGPVTLLDLAVSGALTLARSGCHRDRPDAPPRAAWWAQCGKDGTRYEISGSSFRALVRLGVPLSGQPRRGRVPKADRSDLQIEG